MERMVICDHAAKCTVGPICDAGQPHERGELCKCNAPCRMHPDARCVPYAQAAGGMVLSDREFKQLARAMEVSRG